ncbi:hypothetical protein [Chromohalobacter japonicus]|uniref:hypothetical protein n=1 Tax=Chromohalobacter japonicus TaxID=223900 RepID=UPI00058ED021|nr:hypothetical protein [Chromohalobacter japonicus]
MAEQDASKPYSALIYLGAGARLPLEACRQTAANTWLVEGSRPQAQKLRHAVAGQVGIQVEEAVVAPQPGTQTFHDYNLPWASGLKAPDERLQRLYPGLRCLASEPREALGIGELVERCLATLPEGDSERGALLVIDLGEQAGELLQGLEEAGQLARFACIAVVPPYRQGLDLLPPADLHGPQPLPEMLTWLGEGSRCYQPHPLRQRLQQVSEESRRLAQQLEERTQQRDNQHQKREELEGERDQLRQQLEERTQQRDNQRQQRENLEGERDQLRQQLEERTQQRDNQRQQRENLEGERDQLCQQLEERTEERDDLWHKSEALTQERDELKRRVEELAQQREDALHQNHLNHQALEAERDTTAHLREERDARTRERDEALQQAEQHRQQFNQEQQQRQQLVEQEMRKAEAQLDLIRDILTQGKDF